MTARQTESPTLRARPTVGGRTEPGPWHPFAGPGETITAVEVTRRRVLQGQSRTRIARDLHLPTTEVSRLLDLARTSQLVRITVRDTPEDP